MEHPAWIEWLMVIDVALAIVNVAVLVSVTRTWLRSGSVPARHLEKLFSEHEQADARRAKELADKLDEVLTRIANDEVVRRVSDIERHLGINP